MKIKTRIYAELLLESIKENADFKKVAANFWHLLQKNKQYKDLPKILKEIENVFAQENNFKIVEVESNQELDDAKLVEIQAKLEKRLGGRVLVKPITKQGVTGILAKTKDSIIDLSVENKIGQLRKKINA